MTDNLTPRAAWERLTTGNTRYVDDLREHPDQDQVRRQSLTQAQAPFGLVFGCSDSRVPAELVFDQGLGSLFVVRTAGHVPGSVCLGSIEYGVSVLQIPLVVILGHKGCGAVKATMDTVESGQTPHGFVRELVERISPSVLRATRDGITDPDEIVAQHVRSTIELVTERSVPVSQGIEKGTLGVVGAVYDLQTGQVEKVHSVGAV